jgi:hypothetical protein
MSVILSVRDIAYELYPDTCYHSLMKDAAKTRILNRIQNIDLQKRVRYALEHQRANSVWGIMVDSENGPYVIQNLKYAHVSPAFRRVLRVF